jgi:hypothetical protein
MFTRQIKWVYARVAYGILCFCNSEFSVDRFSIPGNKGERAFIFWKSREYTDTHFYTLAEHLEKASKIKATLVYATSSALYTTQWQKYVEWSHINVITGKNMYKEESLLVYFDYLSRTYSSSSL